MSKNFEAGIRGQGMLAQWAGEVEVTDESWWLHRILKESECFHLEMNSVNYVKFLRWGFVDLTKFVALLGVRMRLLGVVVATTPSPQNPTSPFK